MKIVKKLAITIFVCSIAFATTQAQELDAKTAKLMEETALNYADGFYSGDGERMQKALFPDLRKFSILSIPNFQNDALIESTYTSLIEMSRQGVGKKEDAAKKIAVKPLHRHGPIACVRMTSSEFNDYLHLVQVNDEWKIVNVLWAAGPDSRSRPSVPQLQLVDEKEAIEKSVWNFVKGLKESNAELLEQVLHPKFTEATYTNFTADSPKYIRRAGGDLLTELARAKMARFPGELSDYELEILDFMDGMATVKLAMAENLVYLHVGYINKQWMLVNMLQYQAPRTR